MNTPAISLNEGQQQASDSVFSFLMSSDKEFSISGPAGTGKTTLMGDIANRVLPEYKKTCQLAGIKPVDYGLVFTATTNKAAEVLSRAVGREVRTIHSFLNLKVLNDYKTGETKIRPTNNWVVHDRCLIFIDEASMIDSKLHDYLMKGTSSTCKIIYLGDHCQMAPVRETLSPVYKNQKNFAELTQPMRNAGQPALVDLCKQLRMTVETGKFQPIQEVPGVIDIVDGPGAQQFIDTTFAVENASSRILAYSNKRVKEYLDHIRTLRGYPERFTAGETVINNTAIQFGATMFRVEQPVEIVQTRAPYVLDVKNDPSAKFEVYEVDMRAIGATTSITARIPTDPTHFKQLVRYYASIKDWDNYFWLKNNFPDLRQRDAATVYKAQGSTYDSTFLDLGNIGSCSDPEQLARMLYVGATRARNHLVLFGELPARLFA